MMSIPNFQLNLYVSIDCADTLLTFLSSLLTLLQRPPWKCPLMSRRVMPLPPWRPSPPPVTLTSQRQTMAWSYPGRERLMLKQTDRQACNRRASRPLKAFRRVLRKKRRNWNKPKVGVWFPQWCQLVWLAGPSEKKQKKLCKEEIPTKDSAL